MNWDAYESIGVNEEVSLYVLLLQHKKFYVGITRLGNLVHRLRAHFNMEGAKWTKLYRPIEVVERIERCDKVVERLKTLEYMILYGYDNVRGGAWSQIKLHCKPVPIQVFETGKIPKPRLVADLVRPPGSSVTNGR